MPHLNDNLPRDPLAASATTASSASSSLSFSALAGFLHSGHHSSPPAHPTPQTPSTTTHLHQQQQPQQPQQPQQRPRQHSFSHSYSPSRSYSHSHSHSSITSIDEGSTDQPTGAFTPQPPTPLASTRSSQDLGPLRGFQPQPQPQQQQDQHYRDSQGPIIDTSRRYSFGYGSNSPPVPLSARPQPEAHLPISSPATNTVTPRKRLSLFTLQVPSLLSTPEAEPLQSPPVSQTGSQSNSAAHSSPFGAFTRFASFSSVDNLDSANLPTTSITSNSNGNSNSSSNNTSNTGSTAAFGPLSPSLSISTSTFSSLLPLSSSNTNLGTTPAASTQTKSPLLQHRHPIAIKDLDSILILGPSQTAALHILCSARVLSRIDTIGWFSILGAQKFPYIESSQDAYDIEMATTCMAIEFSANNTQTHNFNTLVLHLLSQLKLIKEQNYAGDVPSHAYNALFLTRIFLNHFISFLSSQDIISYFEGSDIPAASHHEALGTVNFKGAKIGVDKDLVTDPRSYAEQLIQSLLDVILNLDAGSSPTAYEFYQEALNLIIVMTSTQIHQGPSDQAEKNYFLSLLLENYSSVADQLVLRLLWNFTDQRPSPPMSGSLVYSAYNYLFTKAGTSPSSEPHPIADRSVLLLLLLVSQARRDPQWNVYRGSIRNIRDERGAMPDDQKEQAIFSSFRKIFHVICQQIHCEEVCLLLHVLLVENSYFRTYVLSRTDPETLYLPILRMVYEGVEGQTNYSQVYILLVILLIFSEDDVFNDNLQKITMTYQPWFTERLLKSISLGGLAVAVIIRTIQYNLAQHKDVYFHTNSLAILANMSSSLQDLHPYVSQKLVGLFDIVARRYQKLVTRLQAQKDEMVEQNADIIIYGDMVQLVLEILNSTLTHKLKANPQLVYSLLHKQELFNNFRSHPKFKEAIQNIELPVQFFQKKISEAQLRAPTPEEVTEVIQIAARTWPPNLMKTFPDIKFQYEVEDEEDQGNISVVGDGQEGGGTLSGGSRTDGGGGGGSSEFFKPYVWSLLYRNMFVYWDEEKAKILHEYRQFVGNDSALEGIPLTPLP